MDYANEPIDRLSNKSMCLVYALFPLGIEMKILLLRRLQWKARPKGTA